MSDYISREATTNALDALCDRVCVYSKAQRSMMCSACPLGDAFTVIEDDIPDAFPEDVTQTNADRIRAMTDEEMADWLYEYAGSSPNCDRARIAVDNKNCADCWLDWLKQEARNG